MTLFHINHTTTYTYQRPVAFGVHRMMLRPRDDADQALVSEELAISPQPSELSWSRDARGNHVATARFDQQAAELRFASTIVVNHTAGLDTNPASQTDANGANGRSAIATAMAPPSGGSLAQWVASFENQHRAADAGALITDLTRTVDRAFRHVVRHQPGVQLPEQTLALGSGSCRDLAAFARAALGLLGVPTRFVSGYLYLGADSRDRITGGNTHAWAQAYLEDHGWIDLDPSSGRIGNRNLVRVAVVDDPRDAIPLQGMWIGDAGQRPVMTVAVRVSTGDRIDQPGPL